MLIERTQTSVFCKTKSASRIKSMINLEILFFEICNLIHLSRQLIPKATLTSDKVLFMYYVPKHYIQIV